MFGHQSPLAKEFPHLYCYLADVRDALKRLPSRVTDFLYATAAPSELTAFGVTIYHLVHIAQRTGANLPIEYGMLFTVGCKRQHAWLKTPVDRLIIDVAPVGLISDGPILVDIRPSSPWSCIYTPTITPEIVMASHFEREVDQIIEDAASAQRFLSMP